MPCRTATACPRLRWCAGYLRLFCLAAVICGCSDNSGPPRKPVYGSVTGPMVGTFEGAISFLPLPETKGPSATAPIVGGKYRFSAAEGPVPGKYDVLIVPKLKKSIPTIDPTSVKEEGIEGSGLAGIRFKSSVPDKDPF